MTTIRKLLAPALVALALCGLGLALAAGPAAAAPTATVEGKRVTPCRGMQALTFVMFVRNMGCDAALRRITAAASNDRGCPKGWRTRHEVRVRLGKHRSPHVTLCTRKSRAFTYHLPVG